MFFCPLPIRLRMASRICTLPSPRGIRPLRSRTATPSTSREAIVSATGIPPYWNSDYHTLAVQRSGKTPALRREEIDPSLPLKPCASALCLFARQRQTLDERQLGSGMQLSKVHLIHEGTDKEDATAGAAQEIFRRQRVGKRLRGQDRQRAASGHT